MGEVRIVDPWAVPHAVAYANHGRWVADCPRPWCTNAMQVWPGDEIFRCSGPDACGIVADLRWPADPAAIEVLLSARPLARNRNWLAGETLEQLVLENGAHGLIPDEWVAAADGEGLTVLDVADGRAVGGVLMPAIEARRMEIGREIRMRQAMGLANTTVHLPAGDAIDGAQVNAESRSD
jgi:hypothetical protein